MVLFCISDLNDLCHIHTYQTNIPDIATFLDDPTKCNIHLPNKMKNIKKSDINGYTNVKKSEPIQFESFKILKIKLFTCQWVHTIM